VEPGGDLVRDRVADAAEAELVGREREQAQLRDWLQSGRGRAVVFVSGPGGIGKSVLVRGALSSAGPEALVLDGHDAEPTPAGVLRAIGEVMGERIPATPQEAGAAIAAAGATVVVVEAFERLNLIDGWLRNDLLVQLPASVTTVIVGRRPPNLAWRTSPGWRRLLAELVVGPLTEQEAQQLVARHPLPDTVQQLILRFGRGHPLALELAAEAFSRHPDLELPDGPPAEVVEELFEVLLNDLSSVDRETVEAASILRRINRPLLSAVMADDHAPNATDEAWRMLRNLPFVSTTSSGLRLHAVAHNAIGGALEIRNPVRVRQLGAKLPPPYCETPPMGQVGTPAPICCSWFRTRSSATVMCRPAISSIRSNGLPETICRPFWPSPRSTTVRAAPSGWSSGGERTGTGSSWAGAATARSPRSAWWFRSARWTGISREPMSCCRWSSTI
jgi:hypothetical protein